MKERSFHPHLGGNNNNPHTTHYFKFILFYVSRMKKSIYANFYRMYGDHKFLFISKTFNFKFSTRNFLVYQKIITSYR